MTIGQNKMARASALAPQAVTGEGLFLRGFSHILKGTIFTKISHCKDQNTKNLKNICCPLKNLENTKNRFLPCIEMMKFLTTNK